jgi:hypothetical protein
MKPLVKEEEWTKFLKSVEDEEFPHFYFDNYSFNMSLINMAQDYRKLAERNGKVYPYLTASERRDAIRELRYNETEKKRVKNWFQIHRKEKITKLKGIDWLVDDIPIEERIQKVDE